MVQVAAKNGMNFNDADMRGRWWWLKVKWLIERIEDENLINIFSRQHSQHIAVLSYDPIQAQAFTKHWEEANKLLKEIHSLTFPWAKGSKERIGKDEIDSLMDQWTKTFGDRRDPAVKRKFDKVAEAIRAKTAKAINKSGKTQTTKEKFNKLAERRRKKK